MSFSRFCSASAFLVAFCVTATASAQSKVGRQWLTAGLAIAPAFVADDTADFAVANHVFGGGVRARVGFQHVVAAQFVMAAELELGNAYFPASTLAADGRSDGGGGIAWQAGLLGRWVPRVDMSGPALGIGLHTYRASLPDTPVQALSGDLRFGWYFWQGDDFAMIELGYAIPFLEGVDAPVAFDGSVPPVAEQDWTLHRFAFGFNYGF